MDLLTTLPAKTKIVMASLALALFSFSMGALIFGENFVHAEESAFLHHAAESAKADLLLSLPTETH